jgi:rhamnosyltransferase
MSSCAVGIVAYHPDLNILTSLLVALSQEQTQIWLFLNSPLTPGQKDQLDAVVPNNLRFLNDGSNAGLGVAYNQLAEAARLAGARALLLFDQDSSPQLGIAGQLSTTFELLRSNGERPALVGPLAVSAGREDFKPPRRFRYRAARQYGSAWQAEFVLSSGSLLDLDAFVEIGPFREDFFIDAIDIEWCFRSRARGYSCWIDSAVRMPHRLGLGTLRLPFVNMYLARQPPLRLYTYVRNQVAMLRLAHVPLKWKLRIVPYMIFQGTTYFIACAGARRRILYAFGCGFVDGLRLRLGPVRRDRFV